MASTSETKKTVTLRSSDGVEITVGVEAAAMCRVLSNIMEDVGGDEPVPIMNVNAKYLKVVMDYCNKHVAAAAAAVNDGDDKKVAEELKKWEKKYISVSTNDLFRIITAANYLNIEGLMDLATQQIANLMKGKRTEEIREFFGIQNDFTPEEEAEYREKNEWAFK
ncbi:SKP1-like protein 4 [Acorus gramineus]|uniref:SKP1-like protein n=1 Tax=Acorus gramineus TaxID=55184 RepID=A0AAV9BKH9_ACOGR|nr:SKP1-like protein 4 [Acorus gramineus]